MKKKIEFETLSLKERLWFSINKGMCSQIYNFWCLKHCAFSLEQWFSTLLKAVYTNRKKSVHTRLKNYK